MRELSKRERFVHATVHVDVDFGVHVDTDYSSTSWDEVAGLTLGIDFVLDAKAEKPVNYEVNLVSYNYGHTPGTP